MAGKNNGGLANTKKEIEKGGGKREGRDTCFVLAGLGVVVLPVGSPGVARGEGKGKRKKPKKGGEGGKKCEKQEGK